MWGLAMAQLTLPAPSTPVAEDVQRDSVLLRWRMSDPQEEEEEEVSGDGKPLVVSGVEPYYIVKWHAERVASGADVC